VDTRECVVIDSASLPNLVISWDTYLSGGGLEYSATVTSGQVTMTLVVTRRLGAWPPYPLLFVVYLSYQSPLHALHAHARDVDCVAQRACPSDTDKHGRLHWCIGAAGILCKGSKRLGL